ncbi:hypothetical protein CL653_00430 [bacterium]|nr:hypothetical protein [bacterium]|tara:strand:+ start:240 stop:1529 length:1290 start_codon:yes stop_codon:yes gene_type:complete
MKEIAKKIIVYIITLEAKLLLKRTKPQIIAVTGSVGKTATKDAIYSVLKAKTNVRKSEKSFNSDIGVPLTVLGVSNAWSSPVKWMKNIIEGAMWVLFPGKYPEVLVLEMGVDQPGDMQRHCSWIKPDIVVLTRLPEVPVHVEFFDSPEAVIEEKLVLVNSLNEEGVLVYNHDDEKINQVVAAVRQKNIGYSRYSQSDFSITGDDIAYVDDRPVGFSFLISHEGEEESVNVTGSLGVQHAYSYAAAMAVGSLFSMSLHQSAEALKEHQTPAGRMKLVKGLKDTLIVDDTYNSSPIALERALLALNEIETEGRKVAVLGDMLELGQYSTEEHEKIGALVGKYCDALVTIGVRARKIAEGALENGMSEKHIWQYDKVEKAYNELQSKLQEGDIILVKASQSIRAEKLVEEIMIEPDKAAELLTRQSTEWKAK